MPKIEVVRKGVTSSIRTVPTDSTLVILPMTFERIGKEVGKEEEPVRIDGVDDAFEKFKPSHRFETLTGEEATEFIAELEFRGLKDFALENIQKRIPGKRNNIADLKDTIDLLYRLKERWALPRVQRAWSDPQQRKQILEALARLQTKLEKVVQATKEGA
jgi:type VI secretion system protein ImpB